MVCALVVPLIAERFWQCHEDNRMMAKADKEVRVFYPSIDNTNWEYFKPPPSKNSNEDWEDAI